MTASPPLRFLTLAVGGWFCARGVALMLPAWTMPVDAAKAPPGRLIVAAAERRQSPPLSNAVQSVSMPPRVVVSGRGVAPPRSVLVPLALASASSAAAVLPERISLPRVSQAPLAAMPRRAVMSRWSVSAWAFARRGEGASLAAGGTLGGSQIGGRLSYRLNRDAARPLALSARLYAPAERARAAEAALGIEWQPSARLPLRILAERRQALGREGRSAFALMAYGGVGDVPLPRGLRLDVYAQSGLVGLRSRDLFADGSARLSLPLDAEGQLKLGLGAWGAAQPGTARLDLGPQASLRLPAVGGRVTLAVDWRLRAVGNARPGSGPSLTLSTGF